MATIKSFTSLEQSKKLAKILSIDTADMYYIAKPDSTNSNMIPSDICIPRNTYLDGQAHGEFCAWSLAALLEVLKNKIVYGGNDSKSWFVSYTKKNPTKTIFIYKEHLIDACYEAILNLDKEGLL